jgi:hypothetical protein
MAMQVEFFEGSSTKALQDRINAWFKEHHNLASINIIQNIEPGKNGKPGTILVSLWYQELAGQPPQRRSIVPGRFGPPGPSRPGPS